MPRKRSRSKGGKRRGISARRKSFKSTVIKGNGGRASRRATVSRSKSHKPPKFVTYLTKPGEDARRYQPVGHSTPARLKRRARPLVGNSPLDVPGQPRPSYRPAPRKPGEPRGKDLVDYGSEFLDFLSGEAPKHIIGAAVATMLGGAMNNLAPQQLVPLVNAIVPHRHVQNMWQAIGPYGQGQVMQGILRGALTGAGDIVEAIRGIAGAAGEDYDLFIDRLDEVIPEYPIVVQENPLRIRDNIPGPAPRDDGGWENPDGMWGDQVELHPEAPVPDGQIDVRGIENAGPEPGGVAPNFDWDGDADGAAAFDGWDGEQGGAPEPPFIENDWMDGNVINPNTWWNYVRNQLNPAAVRRPGGP